MEKLRGTTHDRLASSKRTSRWSSLLFVSILIGIAILFFSIRFHNLSVYNPYWADDGGGHLQYVSTLLTEHRLPTPEETYLAWHEPGYYWLISGWHQVMLFFDVCDLSGPLMENHCVHTWWTLPSIAFYGLFIAFSGLLTYHLTRHRWLALLQMGIFTILFPGVKLSAYVTNETLSQALILGLTLLFVLWRLWEPRRWSYLAGWSVLLAGALWIKMTAFIVLIAALIVWLIKALLRGQRGLLLYAVLACSLVAALHAPWLLYKQTHFDSALTINAYEELPRASLLSSPGWNLFTTITPNIFFNAPYWTATMTSLPALLLSDTFGDYYNLFNHVDRINVLPDSQRILIDNGRFTTPKLWRALLATNRVALVISAILTIGLLGSLLSSWQRWREGLFSKTMEVQERLWQHLFLLLVALGGMSALLYNILRLPYLERGVAKAQFIWFVMPILTYFSYRYLFEHIKHPVIRGLVLVGPWILYALVAWPMVWVR